MHTSNGPETRHSTKNIERAWEDTNRRTPRERSMRTISNRTNSSRRWTSLPRSFRQSPSVPWTFGHPKTRSSASDAAARKNCD